MELLDWLKDQYGWKNVKFVNEAIIETENGRKRIRSWKNKDLLDWHIMWRDKCSVTPCILLDRMIRNKHEEASITWKDGWLTLHDELLDVYPQRGEEKKWGLLLGTMIKQGQEHDMKIATKEYVMQSFEHIDPASALFDEQNQLHLTRCLQEAKQRKNKANQLRQVNKKVSVPMLDPISSPHQAKRVYDVLVWNGTTDRPERSYRSLRLFLTEWLLKNGQESFESLLEAMYQHGLTRKQALLFLAECLEPYELTNVFLQIEQKRSEESIIQSLQASINEWEQTKQLVKIVSRWLDKKKKVLT